MYCYLLSLTLRGGVIAVHGVENTFQGEVYLSAKKVGISLPATQRYTQANPPPSTGVEHTMMVAAGPFIICDPKDKAKVAVGGIRAVCQAAREQRVDVLALQGPLFAADVPLLSDNVRVAMGLEMDNPHNCLAALIADGVRVVITPGPEGRFCRPVMPQPAYDKKIAALLSEATLVSNPCTLEFGGARVCLARLGLLDYASFVPKPPIQDMYSTLCNTIIGQRSLSPVYPGVPVLDSQTECLDIPCGWGEAVDKSGGNVSNALRDPLPDVLVLPEFCKVDVLTKAAGVVCVNPGQVSFKHRVGTCCVIAVQGTSVRASIVQLRKPDQKASQ
ncbi:hypothetical protein KIPB_001378 [Kipferlia bialata]|uniref:DNA polymerase alpha subunit B n=1 Tax=Kipferlia bialata TaxID=797122 RepID=A0A9K3CNV6_9EUKA|nr:hypothetical protein KIPB_001378 [Kipferlia bialata]|eukprot:g1378.t1